MHNEKINKEEVLALPTLSILIVIPLVVVVAFIVGVVTFKLGVSYRMKVAEQQYGSAEQKS